MMDKYLTFTISQLIVLLFFDFATVRWLHGFEELAIPATIQSWPRCNCGNNILIVQIYRLSWILKRRAQIIWKRKKRMRMRRNPFSRRPLTISTGTIAAQFQPVWETVTSFCEQMNNKWLRQCKLMKQALLTYTSLIIASKIVNDNYFILTPRVYSGQCEGLVSTPQSLKWWWG